MTDLLGRIRECNPMTRSSPDTSTVSLVELTEWFNNLDFDRSNPATRHAEYAELLRIVGPAQAPPSTDAALDAIYDALVQAQACIRGETPEDMTDQEAREDTINKVRDAMRTIEDGKVSAAPSSKPQTPAEHCGDVGDLYAAASGHPQAPSQPVAWRYKCQDGSEVLMLKRLMDVGPFYWAEETPLYVSPVSPSSEGSMSDILRELNSAIDDFWNARTDANVKLVCYWQFKAKEALAVTRPHRGGDQ